jgi:uncharacterized protein (TIGR02270 family)
MRAGLPPRWEVLEAHLDEATFLLGQWERALQSPSDVPEEVLELEERLLAHLDGLVLGEAPVAERLLRPVLADEEAEPEKVCLAVLALLEQGLAAWGALPPLLLEGPPARRAALRRALELHAREEWGARLLPWLEMREPVARATALEVLAFHRHAMSPSALQGMLSSSEPTEQAAALRAARWAPAALGREALERALYSTHPEVRAAALETGVLLGRRVAWSVCQRWAREKNPTDSWALVLWGVGGEDVGALRERLAERPLRREALWALGFSGRLEAADLCFELLGDRDVGVAKLAAESFCAVTGLRLEGEYVRAEEEAEELSLEEDLEQDLHLRPEDDLKLAEPWAVGRWWKQARRDFRPQARYLRGQPFGPERLVEALRQEPMRRRPVLALELGIRTRGRHCVETRALVRRQLAQMAGMSAAHPEPRPFSQLMRGD